MRLSALVLFIVFVFSNILPFASAQVEEDINVTATIAAQASDFQVELESLTSGSPFPQETEIEYRITYGSYLTYPVTFTLQAQWYQGTIDGEGSPSIDVINYVVGSASNGYNSAAPVINTTNKTISWTIVLPANTQNQTVTFKLETTDNYTGGATVSFPVNARILGPGVTTPDESVSLEYQYDAPAATPTPGPTSTPTPSPEKESIKISNIDIRQISKDSALIYVETSLSSNIVISYGTNINQLGRIASSNSLSKAHLVELTGLAPETVYFFKVKAQAAGVGETTSDIFTFTTAKDVPPPEIIQTTFITITNDIIVYDGSSESSNVVILPTNTEFQFKLKVNDKKSIKSIKGYLRDRKVLGIASYLITKEEANTRSINLVELPDGSYTGRLKTAPTPGEYELFISIGDLSGNISEEKIADIKVTRPLTILNQDDEPIEGARALLYIYSSEKKLYEKISSLGLGINNPIFTNSQGELEVALPKGKYKVEISAIGYENQTSEFKIGEENYPTIRLLNSKISIISLFNYYWTGFDDVYLFNTKEYLASLSTSIRFFDLIAALSLGMLVIVTILAFAKRHEMHFESIFRHIPQLFEKKKYPERFIKGSIIDDNSQEVTGANVYLLDETKEEIIARAKTDKKGEFFFKRNPSSKNYLVMAMKEGFESHPVISYEEGTDISMKLERTDQLNSPFHFLKHLFTGSFGLTFEVFIILSLFFELLFMDTFGFAKTLPYFLLTLLNFVAWILLIRHQHSKVAY